jgi:tetratricopeptide (TPR) repeat protein
MPKKNKKQQQKNASHSRPNQATTVLDSKINLREQFQKQDLERYQRKLLRRQVLQDINKFLADKATVPHSFAETLLFQYTDNIPLVKETLDSFGKNAPEKILGLRNIVSTESFNARVEKVKSEKELMRFKVEATKIEIAAKVPNPLVIQIPVDEQGPCYSLITDTDIRLEVLKYMESDFQNFYIVGDFPFERKGDYEVFVKFIDSQELPLRISLQLSLGDVPNDMEREWDIFELLSIENDEDLAGRIKTYSLLDHFDDADYVCRLLKTSFIMGYWKTPESQAIYKNYKYLRLTLPPKEVLVDAEGLSDLARDVVSKTASQEEMKLLNLDLPPLVRYDLVHATIDTNVLQRAFVIPNLRYLRDKNIGDFTASDLQLLSPANQAWRISDLKKGSYGKTPVDPRTLAKLLLVIAKLQFTKMDLGTFESSIRYCLSSYSTLMGEYLVQQQGRYDLARDYYLEAISLNLSQNANPEFPTSLFFRSFPNEKHSGRGQVVGDSPVVFLRQLEDPRWHYPDTLHNAARSFMELGTRHFRWASRWFEECSPVLRRQILSVVVNQLTLGELADFSDCVNSYRRGFNRLQLLLVNGKQQDPVLHRVVEATRELSKEMALMGFLVSQTNIEIINYLIHAGEYVESFLHSSGYRDQRIFMDMAISSFQKVIDHGHDNYTALWAEYLVDIAQKWKNLCTYEIESIAKSLSPNIQVFLAEKSISLSDQDLGPVKPRIIVKVLNDGSGLAERVSLKFMDADGEVLLPATQDFDLEPGARSEAFFFIEETKTATKFQFQCSGTYYDQDRKLCEFHKSDALTVEPLDNFLFEKTKITNPFKTDQEVEDRKMFVGRDNLIKEVQVYAVDQPSGSLLMLNGQKRVGKSSFLLFLERSIDNLDQSQMVLAVRITWLLYANHNVADLFYEIALAIQEKYASRYQTSADVVSRAEFRHSYSVAFNDTLRALKKIGIRRLVLMWDEFDGIVNNLDKVDMGFDRVFFEYLRGLSKRKDVTIVLTGGELLPSLFERWGEIFNHDKTWRIAYLSPTDGSVEKLVRNEYVRDVLNFTDDAINLIKDYTACNPYFVQWLCWELVHSAPNKKSSEICVMDVQESIKKLVQQLLDTKYMRHLYSPRLAPDALDMAIIAVVSDMETKSGRRTFVSQEVVAAQILQRTQDEVINRTNELVRREVLERNSKSSSEIRMKLPLFRDWFVDNKPEYQQWAPLLRS